MDESDADLEDFLVRYATTLTQFDAEGAADLWQSPGMIVDDRFVAVTESREAMVQGLEQSYPFYQQLGLASVGHELLARQRLADAVTLVRVRWLFFDDQGALLTDSHAHYVLRRDEHGLRACVCVQDDDLDKLAALAAARGIEMPGQSG
jgi:hypothetical protein